MDRHDAPAAWPKVMATMLPAMLGMAAPGQAADAPPPAGLSLALTNPLLPGADPSIVYHAGHYYLVLAERGGLWIYRAPTLAGLAEGRKTLVHRPPASGPRSCNLWAPELHFLNGRWYIYYAADDGWNENHRMFVLQSEDDNPLSDYTFRGKIADPAADRWAIDGTVLRAPTGELYFLWSGWEGRSNGQQNLYIAPMADPCTLAGPRVKISSPTEAWERRSGPRPCYVNEAPAVLQRGGKTFLAYSANGFWSNDYSLGLLVNTDGNFLRPESWRKIGPMLSKAAGAYNLGHNCFFTSPDGTEDWILYHAIDRPNTGGRGRTLRAQRFSWDAGGMPVFGEPAVPGQKIAGPSGELAVPLSRADTHIPS